MVHQPRSQRSRSILLRLPPFVWLTFVIASVLFAAAPAVSADAGKWAVATESKQATQAAISQLRAGGNAVDAAISAALTAGVVSASSSGIGGGGFALYWEAATGQCHVLDFRELAPAAIDGAAFERRPFPFAERGRYVGVPGELAGLSALSERFGKRPWRALVAPAVRAAGGYRVEPHLASALVSNRAELAEDPGLARLYLPAGAPPRSGQLRTSPALRKTLEAVLERGAGAFYAGEIAERLAKATRAAGGALSTEDLANYRPRWRTPLRVSWGGHDVYTMPAPSAGGLMLGQVLSMFSKEELAAAGHGSSMYVHRLAEAMRAALHDRFSYVGDPDRTPIDYTALLGSERMVARRRTIADDRTRALPQFSSNEQGTHHISILDTDGNAIALTTTINSGFGATLLADGTGVILNDELNDFNASGQLRKLGFALNPNAARAGVRPVSSMTPTIAVRQGRAVLAVGGSGGMTIGPNVTQAFLAHMAFGQTPEQAISGLRFYVPLSGATLELEDNVSSELQKELEARGEVVRRRRPTTSAVQMVAALPDGSVLAAADPRKSGSAAVK